jgi:hypothetical protein
MRIIEVPDPEKNPEKYYLIKQIKHKDLKKNEIYYIKDKGFTTGLLFTFIEYVNIQYFGKCAHCVETQLKYTCYLDHGHKCFKLVSREEYYKKLKEKYDQTCLDIVLKRLVNEHFCW